MQYNFLDIVRDVTSTTKKIPQSKYCLYGIYKIFDQGKSYIGGYSNIKDGVANDFPYIIFGDHTRVVKYVDEPCFIGADGVKLLKVINDAFLPKYIYYYLLANPVKNLGYSRHFKLLKEMKIKKITLNHQQKIIKEFDELIDKIKINKKVLLKYDEIVKSQFIEMFDKYDKIELYKIANIIMGQSPDSKSYNDEKKGLPFYQGKADYGEKYTITRHWTSIPTKIAKKGDVLMSVRAPVGPLNIASCDCCIGRGLCSINANTNYTNNEFIYYALNAVQDHIASFGTGSTFKAINKLNVCNLLLPNAPIELQNKFADFVQQIDKSKFIVQKQIKLLEELLEKKMNEYFGD